MNIVNKLTLRHIAENKKRTIITIIGIIISVAMITAVTTSFQTFLNYFKEDKTRMDGDWHYQFNEITTDDYDTILKAENVNSVAIKNIDAAIKVGNEELNAYNGGVIESVNKEYFENFKLNVTEGTFPKNDKEILVSKEYINSNKLDWKIGDTVTIDKGIRIYDGGFTFDEEYKSDRLNYISGEVFEKTDSETVTISGFYEGDPHYYNKNFIIYKNFDASSNDKIESAFVKAEKVNGMVFSQSNELAKEIGKDEPDSVNRTLISFNGVFDVEDPFFVTMYGILVLIMSLILIASFELIYNAFSISLAEKSKYLGMLASVGATKSQKRASIYFEGLILGAIGIPIGLLAGTGAMAITFKLISPLLRLEQFGFYSEVKYIVTFPAILAGIVISIITILISSYIPARKASKTTAINAIRKTDSVKLKAKNLKTNKLVRKLFGFEGELALKNIKRTGKKSKIITASIALSVILFLTVNSFATLFGASFDVMLNQYDYNYVVGYELGKEDDVKKAVDNYTGINMKRYMCSDFLASSALADYRTDEYKDYIKETTSAQENVESLDETLFIYSLDDESFKTFCSENNIDSSSYFNGNENKAIFLNQIQVSGYNKKKIDFIKSFDETKLKGKSFDFDARYYDEKIEEEKLKTNNIEITDVLNITESKEIPIQNVPALVTTDKVFKNVFDYDSNNNSGRRIYSNGYIKVDDTNAFDEYLNDYIKTNALRGVSCDNIEGTAQAMNNMLTVMYVFIYGFIVTMTLVSIANIINTISTGIENRRREFAMFKSVGLDKKGFRKMISFESIFYGLKALVYGLPISIIIHFVIYYLISRSVTTKFLFPWQMYIVVIIAVFLIVSLSLLYSVNKIKNDNIIETLKSDDN